MKKTIYLLKGIVGLQNYSTKVVGDELETALKVLGWNVVSVELNVENGKRGIFRELFYRYFAYPLKCRGVVPKGEIAYIVDHANAHCGLWLHKPKAYVVHFHDALSMRPPWDFPYAPALSNVLIWILGVVFKKPGIRSADHVFTISEFSRSELLHYVGLPECKVSVVYQAAQGIDSKQGGLDLPDSALTILTIGVPSRRKGYSDVQGALVNLAPDVVGMINWLHVGELPSNSTAGLPDNVRVICVNGVSDMGRVWRSSDIFVSASRYEGFGLPALESYNCGVPAVISDIPTHKEVMGDGADYYALGDPLDLALAVKRVLQGRAERNLPRHYSWGKTAQRITKELERFL